MAHQSDETRRHGGGSGLPADLRSSIEELSGASLDGISVHRDSAEPGRIGALAYARGSEIHLAPGEEHRLPHEAWHAAQQAQGRVRPMTGRSSIAVNHDRALEDEADEMGARAASAGGGGSQSRSAAPGHLPDGRAPAEFVSSGVTLHVDGSPPSIPSGPVAQLTDATVYVNDANRGQGHADMGGGRVGGVSHAEQQAWAQAQNAIGNAFQSVETDEVEVNFTIDQTVCPACQDWFEGAAFDRLTQYSDDHEGKQFRLTVTVDATTVRVLGPRETNWPATVADDVRITLVEELTDMLITWGGTTQDDNPYLIRMPDDDGTMQEYTSYESRDTLVRDHEDEIRAAADQYQRFVQTGSWLHGRQRDLDMAANDQEAQDQFEREYLAAHRY